MQKILLFSHNCFSNENANGITMKNLLSAWSAEEKAEFYCSPEAPDFSAASQYFRVTDIQAAKSFFGKKSQHAFSETGERIAGDGEQRANAIGRASQIPSWFKKHKYNFCLKWIREYLWILGPWGHRQFWEWLDHVSPDVIVYMVGESIFMDQLVLKVHEKTGKPLILYNGEAFRIIDLKTRHGLERSYYRRVEALYEELSRKASFIIYNCETLQEEYGEKYPSEAKSMVAYNSAESIQEPYPSNNACVITYFGNLGVGRSAELLKVAGVLAELDPSQKLHIYGNAQKVWEEKFQTCPNICYHGFINAKELRRVIAASDILLHVETFDEEYIPKLKYAFSTKIAQCLCSGRCFISFAPQEMASSRYLKTVEGAVLVSDEKALSDMLGNLIRDPQLRSEYAEKVYQAGLRNHQMETTSRKLRQEVELLFSNSKMICESVR